MPSLGGSGTYGGDDISGGKSPDTSGEGGNRSYKWRKYDLVPREYPWIYSKEGILGQLEGEFDPVEIEKILVGEYELLGKEQQQPWDVLSGEPFDPRIDQRYTDIYMRQHGIRKLLPWFQGYAPGWLEKQSAAEPAPSLTPSNAPLPSVPAPSGKLASEMFSYSKGFGGPGMSPQRSGTASNRLFEEMLNKLAGRRNY